ncbi:hypothetical protein L9F63_026849, partial [Diploptera punctata]
AIHVDSIPVISLAHYLGHLMTIDFYYLPGSAPCRSVLLTAKAVGVDLNLKLTNLMAGEHLTPEFIKMNPQHTIPTLNDNGFCLWESKSSFLGYLVDQYAKDDSLYPKDPQEASSGRSKAVFRYWEHCTRDLGITIYPIYFAKAPADPEKMKKIEESYQFLDKFLEGQEFVAGNSLTIADLAIVSSVSTAEIVGFDITRYPNVTKWFEKMKKVVPGYDEINHKGCLEFKKIS